MGVNHLGPGSQDQENKRLWSAIRAAAKATLQNGAIGRAGLRVYDGGWIRIEGGGLSVTGQATVSGDLFGTSGGVLDWLGNVFLRGPTLVEGTLNVTGNSAFGGTLDILDATTISGPLIVTNTMNVTGNSAFGGSLDILGATAIGGAVTLNNDLTLGTGRIIAGPITIDKLGSAGGRIASSGTLILEAGAISFLGPILGGNATFLGDLTVGGAKNFRMPHPTKDAHWLRHGSTESPVSGTEYTGRATIGESGSVVVELPDYFEGLNKPEGRTVHLTAVGRPFPTGADDVIDGKVTVYGDPGRDVSWLVKAERYGGDFLLEEEVPPEPFSED